MPPEKRQPPVANRHHTGGSSCGSDSGRTGRLPHVRLHQLHETVAPLTLAQIQRRIQHKWSAEEGEEHESLGQAASRIVAEASANSSTPPGGTKVRLSGNKLSIGKDREALKVPLMFAEVGYFSAGPERWVIAVVPSWADSLAGCHLATEKAAGISQPPLVSRVGTDEAEKREVWLLTATGGDPGGLMALLALWSCAGILRTDLLESHEIRPKALGSGGCATVYLAKTKRSPFEKVAVKLLSDTGRKAEAMIVREVGLLLLVQGSSNIVNFKGLFLRVRSPKGEFPRDLESRSQWAVTLECCSGGDLHGMVRAKHHLLEEEAAAIMRGLLSALAHIHRLKVIHRDVKPENILMGDGGKAVLSDFGVAAKLTDEAGMDMRCGSPGYVAPEVLKGLPYGAKSDIFGAGVTLYFILTGVLPFPGDDVKVLLRRNMQAKIQVDVPQLSHVSPAGKTFLLAMLRKDEKSRLDAVSASGQSWFHMSFESSPKLLALSEDDESEDNVKSRREDEESQRREEEAPRAVPEKVAKKKSLKATPIVPHHASEDYDVGRQRKEQNAQVLRKAFSEGQANEKEKDETPPVEAGASSQPAQASGIGRSGGARQDGAVAQGSALWWLRSIAKRVAMPLMGSGSGEAKDKASQPPSTPSDRTSNQGSRSGNSTPKRPVADPPSASSPLKNFRRLKGLTRLFGGGPQGEPESEGGNVTGDTEGQRGTGQSGSASGSSGYALPSPAESSMLPSGTQESPGQSHDAQQDGALGFCPRNESSSSMPSQANVSFIFHGPDVAPQDGLSVPMVFQQDLPGHKRWFRPVGSGQNDALSDSSFHVDRPEQDVDAQSSRSWMSFGSGMNTPLSASREGSVRDFGLESPARGAVSVGELHNALSMYRQSVGVSGEIEGLVDANSLGIDDDPLEEEDLIGSSGPGIISPQRPIHRGAQG